MNRIYPCMLRLVAVLVVFMPLAGGALAQTPSTQTAPADAKPPVGARAENHARPGAGEPADFVCGQLHAVDKKCRGA